MLDFPRGTFNFLTLAPILIYLAFIIFGIYIAVSILKAMRERNTYLKDIRDEMRKKNVGE